MLIFDTTRLPFSLGLGKSTFAQRLNIVRRGTITAVPTPTLVGLSIALVIVLVILAVALWLILRYTCTREGRVKGVQVQDDRDEFYKVAAAKRVSNDEPLDTPSK